jgi:hypothetical protein
MCTNKTPYFQEFNFFKFFQIFFLTNSQDVLGFSGQTMKSDGHQVEQNSRATIASRVGFAAFRQRLYRQLNKLHRELVEVSRMFET